MLLGYGANLDFSDDAYVRDQFDCKRKMMENGDKLRWQQKSPDYWALQPTTGLFTHLLSFAPDDWAFHPTHGLFTRLLGFAPDYWACTQRLSFSPDCWAFARIRFFFPNTGLSPQSHNQFFALITLVCPVKADTD